LDKVPTECLPSCLVRVLLTEHLSARSTFELLGTVLGFFDKPFTAAYFGALLTVEEKQNEQNKINKFLLAIQEKPASVKLLIVNLFPKGTS